MLTKAQLPTAEDYVKLYQTGGGTLPRYSPIQRGRGLGSILKSLYHLVKPILITQGKKVAHQALNFGQDLIAGEDFKSAARERLKLLKKDILGQSGTGKRKRRTKQDLFNVSSRKISRVKRLKH